MAPALKTGMFALLLYSSTTIAAVITSSPLQALQALERRQGSCPASNPISCAVVDPKLPANFCCGANTSCISIDSSSSALCCPNTGSCTAIQPINCDVALQNAANSNPGPIFTSNLNSKLPTCSNACCPFGYTCNQRADGTSYCLLDSSKAITAPVSSATPSPSTATSTSKSSSSTSTITATVTATPTLAASGINSTSHGTSDSSSAFPTGIFLAGLLPGLIVGALVVAACIFLIGRRKGKKRIDANSRSNPSMYGKRPEIVDPYGDTSTKRPDFMQRTKTIGFGKSLFGRKDQPDGTPGLPFDSADEGWKNLTPPKNSNIPVNALGNQVAVGPNAIIPATIGQPRPMTYGAENAIYQRPVNDFGYPVTPRRDNRYTTTDDPTGEMVKIYTPQTNSERPPAAVAPSRGMSTQRRSRDSGWGSYEADEDKPRPNTRAPYPITTDDRSVYAPSTYETLTPATYKGGLPKKPKQTPVGGGVRERPETTFTDMLRAINFPDPDRRVPSMPAIPKEYR